MSHWGLVPGPGCHFWGLASRSKVGVSGVDSRSWLWVLGVAPGSWILCVASGFWVSVLGPGSRVQGPRSGAEGSLLVFSGFFLLPAGPVTEQHHPPGPGPQGG